MTNEEERAGIVAILREKLSESGVELRLLSLPPGDRTCLPAEDVFLHDRKAVRLMREAMEEG